MNPIFQMRLRVRVGGQGHTGDSGNRAEIPVFETLPDGFARHVTLS